MTLFYSTPLIFTGLSVAVAFHAGLFNIGAEGQLTRRAGGRGGRRPWPGLGSPMAPVLAALAAILAGTCGARFRAGFGPGAAATK